MSLLIKNTKMPTERTLCPCYHMGSCWATEPPCDRCSDHPFPCDRLQEIENAADDSADSSNDMEEKMMREDGWIPVEERLPDTDQMMLVSCRTKKGVASVNRAYYSDGFWHGSGSMSGVEAWMPLPEPYEE